MARIQNFLDNIKKAIYGKEVRLSIYDAIKAIDDEVEETTNKVATWEENERQRKSAENARVKNEQSRSNAEATRVSNKSTRKSQEIFRTSAEKE